MAKLKWFYWGILFSIILFVVIYFLIYTKVVNNPTTVLMLGNKDISSLGVFFSSLKNVILSSLVIGFVLGILTGIGSRKKGSPNQIV